MLAFRGLQAPFRASLGLARANSTIAGTIYYRINYHDPSRLALVCPHEDVKWSYADLWVNVQQVAGGLKNLGYGQGSIVVTDLGNCVANLLLQFAAAHNGMQVLTVKSKEEFDKLNDILSPDGAVMTDSSSFLSSELLDIKGVDATSVRGLTGKAGEGATDRQADLAYYSSDTPTGNREVYLYGVGTAGLLETQPEDQVCVAANLNHPYGMGMVISAIVRSASVYLPDMANLDIGDSTLVMTDSHHIPKLADAIKSSGNVRGGVLKVGSGYDVIGAPGAAVKQQHGGVDFYTIGTSDPCFRPLFNACVDKYYSYK